MIKIDRSSRNGDERSLFPGIVDEPSHFEGLGSTSLDVYGLDLFLLRFRLGDLDVKYTVDHLGRDILFIYVLWQPDTP